MLVFGRIRGRGEIYTTNNFFFLILLLTETKINSNDFVSMLSFEEIKLFLIAIKIPQSLDKLLVAIDLSHLYRE